jgi:hypothetical protein
MGIISLTAPLSPNPIVIVVSLFFGAFFIWKGVSGFIG